MTAIVSRSGVRVINGSRPIKGAAYLLTWVLPALIPVGYLLNVNALATVTFFVVFPAMGWIIGQDHTATKEPPELPRWERVYYRLVPLIYVPVLYASLGYGTAVLLTEPMSVWSMGGMVLSLYVVGACGTAVAHELLHHREWVEQERCSAAVGTHGVWLVSVRALDAPYPCRRCEGR